MKAKLTEIHGGYWKQDNHPTVEARITVDTAKSGLGYLVARARKNKSKQSTLCKGVFTVRLVEIPVTASAEDYNKDVSSDFYG